MALKESIGRTTYPPKMKIIPVLFLLLSFHSHVGFEFNNGKTRIRQGIESNPVFRRIKFGLFKRRKPESETNCFSFAIN